MDRSLLRFSWIATHFFPVWILRFSDLESFFGMDTTLDRSIFLSFPCKEAYSAFVDFGFGLAHFLAECAIHHDRLYLSEIQHALQFAV